MHKYLCLLLALLASLLCKAQKEPNSPPTNFHEFINAHGGFVQIEDFSLERMILELASCETRICKVTAARDTKIFYQVISGQHLGSVDSDDYPELIEAYAALHKQSLDEKKNTRDYLENKYIDCGGMEIEYIVQRKSLTWFIKPHKFCTRILLLKDPAIKEASLKEGVIILETLN